MSDATTVEERRVDAAGLRIACLEAGQGTALVLLHGEGDSAASWRPVMPELAKLHRVYAPSLPGHGDSDKPSVDYTPEFYARFVRDFLRAIGADRAILVGHSLGGLVSMRFALQEPGRVGALVLVDSSGLGRTVNPVLSLLSLPGVRHVAGAWTRTELGALQRPLVRSALQFAKPSRAPREWLADQRRLARTPGFVDAFLTTNRRVVGPLGQRHILVDELHRLTMPTLVVWGARDAVVPVRHARAAGGRLPQGELVVIPDAGHAPHVERPREFIAALQAFLRERPGPTAARRAVP
jgi:pimeloyl-ACP methyl ester carboxylesterase